MFGNMKDKRNTRRGGYYWFDGEPYVSVTNVISVLDKPALRYWYGQMVFRAMAKDPTLDEKEALAAPYRKNKEAKDRGTTIHSIVEAWKHSQSYLDSVPDKFNGYAQAFYKFLQDHKMSIVTHERSVKSDLYKYAGTLDLLVKRNGNELPTIVDIKTGKDIYPESFLQLSAYKQALKEEGQEVDGMMVILLGEDGGYKMEFKSEDYLDQFLACLKLYRWKNGNGTS